jgi:predicted nuclease of predicted toxin-antitoxin system
MSSLATPNGDGSTTSSASWQFLVDENLPQRLTRNLRALGYTVEDVRDVGLRARPDSDVWVHAQAQQETLITEDKDFANPQHYPPPHAGLIISDLPDKLTIATQVQILVDAVISLTGQSLASAVVTVSPGRIRVRR